MHIMTFWSTCKHTLFANVPTGFEWNLILLCSLEVAEGNGEEEVFCVIKHGIYFFGNTVSGGFPM